MKPSTKAPQIEQALNSILGGNRIDSIIRDTCVFCKSPATEFKDELSKKEFSISGICQTCQDEIFP